MASFGAGASGSGAPQQPPGGEGAAAGHGGGALQPPPCKPTLERTYTLMQGVQGNCILVRGVAGAKRFRWPAADTQLRADALALPPCR